jgi:CheY-like chemotaxis protein
MNNSKLLFYLDDDADDLFFFKIAAEKLGHRVSIFTEGQEMLQVMKIQVEKPDVIFLDVHMPVLNGEEILKVIKHSDDFKNIPVVMISGAYPKKLVKYFNEAGVNYLMKKTELADLENSLHEVLRISLSNLKASA